MPTRRATVRCVAILFQLSALFAYATPCVIDLVPAATVLLPYFEADVGSCGSIASNSTRVSVVNTKPAPVLAHVTVWSDLAVPVFVFDIYLAGNTVESFDLRAMLCSGDLPMTGSAVSPVGTLADPPVAFPGCNDTDNPANGAPVYGPGAIDETVRADLRAWLTGLMAPTTGTCAGMSHSDTIARGYLTIDTVSACSLMTPAVAGYESLLTADNVLMSDATLTWADGLSRAINPVPLEAAPLVFSPGDTTFYGRYSGTSAVDAREPLPTTFSAAVASDTEFIVWRETSFEASTFPCGAVPFWYPLGASNASGAGPLVLVDGQENLIGLSDHSFPLATQRVTSESIGAQPSAESKLIANLQSDATARPAPAGQAWLIAFSGTGTFPGAAMLDSSCDAAPFTWTSPGPTLVP